MVKSNNMKNNKGVAPILIVLIIIGVLALGGGTYYFLVKKAPKPVACTQEAKICPDGSAVSRTGPNCEFAECPAAKADETTDWNTYRNDEYGFEIKYPNEWEFLVNDPYGEKYPSFRDKKYNGSFEWPGLDINWPPIYGLEISKTESRFFKLEDARNDLITISFTLDPKIIIATCKLYLDPDVIKICNQMLSTFKFIETDETADWKTYKDENVTFKFPPRWVEKPILIRGSGYTQEFEDPENKFSFTFSSTGNYSQVTGKPYANIDEYINMPYKVKAVVIDGQEGRQPLPRAGSENINSAMFFSKDSKFIYTFELKTGNNALDTSVNDVNEGQRLFNQMLSSFKFLD